MSLKVGIKKLEFLVYQKMKFKLRDLTVITFESIPACDRQADGHAPIDCPL